MSMGYFFPDTVYILESLMSRIYFTGKTEIHH